MNDKEQEIADKLLKEVKDSGPHEQMTEIMKYSEFVKAVAIRMDAQTRKDSAYKAK